MAASEVELGRGLTSVVRAVLLGEETVESEAAMQLLAESLLWWRLLARNPGKAIATSSRAEGDADAAERAYYAAKGLVR